MSLTALGKVQGFAGKAAKCFAALAVATAMAFSVSVASADNAYADATDGTSQDITVTVDGYAPLEDMTAQDFDDLGLLNTAPAACLYKATAKDTTYGKYEWRVIAYKDYVTVDDLLAYITGDDSKTVADIKSMNMTAYEESESGFVEEPYTKYDFNAKTLQDQDLFFNNMTPQGTFNPNVNSPSPIAFAFSWHEATTLRTGIADTAYLNIKNDYDAYQDDVRFFMGLDAQTATATDGDSVNMGRRLPYGVTAVDITLL